MADNAPCERGQFRLQVAPGGHSGCRYSIVRALSALVAAYPAAGRAPGNARRIHLYFKDFFSDQRQGASRIAPDLEGKKWGDRSGSVPRQA